MGRFGVQRACGEAGGGGRGRRGSIQAQDSALLLKAALLQCPCLSHRPSVTPALAVMAKERALPDPRDGLHHTIGNAEIEVPLGHQEKLSPRPEMIQPRTQRRAGLGFCPDSHTQRARP